MTPDRSKAPLISPLALPEIMDYSKYTLNNGVEIYSIHDPKQEVFKMDITFDAGVYFQPAPLIASTTVNMLNEGTSGYTSAQIAETFDYYGAYIDFSSGMQKSEVSMISLNRYARETISLAGELILASTFPEKELRIFLKNKKQLFLIENEKTKWLAQKEFMRVLFGPNHPYANVIKEEFYDTVDISGVKDYYNTRYTAKNCKIFLSGNISGTIFDTVGMIFSNLKAGEPTYSESIPFFPEKKGEYHIEKEGSVQTSLRIGRDGVGLKERDYPGFQLLNTILGGYFGSRLMSNIREDKGYTYGIYSFNANLPQASYWCISSDINKEYTTAVIEEIRKEIKKLQTEKVGTLELNTVKNYYYGEILRELDGVFSQSDTLKHNLIHDLDNRFYLEMIEKIKNISSEEILELANKYWNPDEFYTVTAG